MVECDACGVCPIRGVRYQSAVIPDYDLCGTCLQQNKSPGAAPFLPSQAAQAASVQDAVVSWIWDYFSAGCPSTAAGAQVAAAGTQG